MSGLGRREVASPALEPSPEASRSVPAAVTIVCGAVCVRALATSASPLLAPPLSPDCCLPAVLQPVFPADTRPLCTWRALEGVPFKVVRYDLSCPLSQPSTSHQPALHCHGRDLAWAPSHQGGEWVSQESCLSTRPPLENTLIFPRACSCMSPLHNSLWKQVCALSSHCCAAFPH